MKHLIIQTSLFLTNKNVAVVGGFFYEELMRTHFPSVNLLLTNSTEESVEQLVLGNVDAVLDSYAVINFYVQRYFITGVTNAPLGSYVTEHYYDTGLSEVVMSLNIIMIQDFLR